MSTINITKENFNQEVAQSDRPVLLDFWASWCGPCRMVGPIIDEIARERTDVKVGKINVDEQPELATQFQVLSIPTLMVITSRMARSQTRPRELGPSTRSSLCSE